MPASIVSTVSINIKWCYISSYHQSFLLRLKVDL